jgi:predicted nucleic acid-binding protein
MIYLDTNIFIYAFCKNVDDQSQKIKSQEILRESIKNDKLIVSEIVLYEFAFVSRKLKEDVSVIDNNLKFLSNYERMAIDISSDVLSLISKTSSYKQSFDIYHLCFSNHFNCTEFITYDNGFKKFQDFSHAKNRNSVA